MSNSSASYTAPKRTGMNVSDYNQFIDQGRQLASGADLLVGTARDENFDLLRTVRSNDLLGLREQKIYGAEKDFKTVGQDTLDKMMSMFKARKSDIDTRKAMPGRSQLQATDFNIG
jgi:hypothetical protein